MSGHRFAHAAPSGGRHRAGRAKRLARSTTARVTSAMLVLAGLPVLITSASVLGASPAAAANAPLTCAPGTIYNLDNARHLYSLNTTTGVNTPATPSTLGGQATPNGLGVSADGKTAFTIDQTISGSTTTVDVEDITAGTFTAHSVSVAGITGLIAGGVNPTNGKYYYGGWNSASTTFILYSYDATTAVGTEVGTITPPGGGTFGSGDLAFDGGGNLFIMAGATTTGKILAVPGPLPASGTGALTNSVLSSLTGSSSFNGIAFSADGKLYAQDSAGSFRSINPNTGVATNLPNETGQSGGTIDDLASCAFTGSLIAEKNIVGRVGSGDQFKLTITGGGVSSGNVGTTSGSTTGLQTAAGEIAGPVIGIPLQSYTVTETASGTTNLANYSTAYSCKDSANNTVASGTGTTVSFSFPAPSGNQGAAVTCVFTNTPASLSITKTPSPTTASPSTTSITYTFGVTNTGPLTLNNVLVTDAQTAPSLNSSLSAITCAAGTNGSFSLASGASTTCTATYTVSQADKDNGSIKDTGTVTGTPPGGTAVSASASATVPVTSNPSLSVVKSANPTTVTAAGQTVNYTVLVKNTGNVTVSAVSVADNAVAPAGAVTFTCSPTTIAPNATSTCTGSYTVTQADMNAGSIVDTATASATPTGSQTPITQGSNQVTVTATQTRSLAVTKTPSPTTVSAVGQTVTYTLDVTNTGNTTVSSLSAADNPVAPAGTVTFTCSPTTLAPNAHATCTGTYAVTQADLDAGSIKDTATVSGTAAGQPVAKTSSQAVVNVTQNPALTVVKSANVTTVTAANQTIHYSFLVTNTGNVTETNVGVTDAQSPPSLPATLTVSCPGAGNGSITLAPGGSVTCTADYTVTQADIDNGSITDTGTASGKAPDGSTTTSPGSSVTVTATRSRMLSVTKSASPTSVSAAGQTVTYTLTVTNTGNTTVTALSALDNPVAPTTGTTSFTCTPTTLAPNAQATCTGTYSVSQADMDNGIISDTATVTGTAAGQPAAGTSNQVDVTVAQTRSVSVSKSADVSSVSAVGDHIVYTLTVTNTGNTTVSALGAVDNAVAPTTGTAGFTCSPTTLAPTAQATCTATYSVTQADLDHGIVSDTATVSGTAAGQPVTKTSNQVNVTATQNPALTVLKSQSGGPNPVNAVGQTVTYSFVVTNSGNVTETNVGVSDVGPAGSVPVSCPAPGNGSITLAPGGSVTCTASYSVTQADLDAGSITDTGTASGKAPDGSTTISDGSMVTVPVMQSPALTVVKSQTGGPNPVTAAGQTITYSFVVTNSGNVTETNVGVTDAGVAPAGSATVSCPAPGNGSITLAPNASVTCTASYTVTQADIDHGSVKDTATASGKAPLGSTTTSPGSSVIVPVTQTPGLTVVKSQAGGPNPVTAAGQTITYSFKVTNSGNVTETNVGVTDAGPAGSVPVTCPAPGNGSITLAPGASVTCTATYTVTQADIDAGSVTDTGTATGKAPDGSTTTSPGSMVTVPVMQNPGLTVLKSQTGGPNPVTAVGQTITYSFTITNSGNVTETHVGVTDQGTAPAGSVPVTCPAPGNGSITLAPGASVTCTATYTVTQADLDHGSIGDTGTATGTKPGGGTTTSPGSGVTVPVTQNPALSVVKTASPTTVTDPGQHVTYSFKVTNTGNVTIHNVAISDTQTAPSSAANLSAITCPQSTLAPGASEVCTATYTVTQSDLNHGSITDTAVATGLSPNGAPVTSPPSMATVQAVQTILSGRAYALGLDARLGSVALVGPSTVDDTGSILTAASTSTPNPCAANLAVTSVVLTGNVCAGVTTVAKTSSTATSSVANATVSILTLPTIVVQAVQSTSTTTCAGSSGSVTIAYLAVGGVVLISKPTPIAPNTGLNVGVVKLVLNQQIPFSGVDSGLTVNAIAISVNAVNVATANVVIASSTSDIICNAPYLAPTMSGQAYDLNVNATALSGSVIGDITVNQTSPVVTNVASTTPAPCVGAAVVTDVAFTGDLCASVTTTPTVGSVPASSTASASVANVSIGVPNLPVIAVQGVQSTSTTTCAGSTGSVTIAYLKVGSTVVISKPTTIAPNTKVVVGSVTLVLNQQIAITGADNGLIVNAVVITANALVAHLSATVASSTSDILNC